MPPYTVIRKRADFLAANRGQRHVTPGFILLVQPRKTVAGVDADLTPRLGITVTKKVGNAVTRNRMKRRFRALAAQVFEELAIPHADHILIGRRDGIERDFTAMRDELAKGLVRLARKLEERG